jgi:hypothetical protein
MTVGSFPSGCVIIALVIVGLAAAPADGQPVACIPTCPGDCDASASVSVNELVRGVSIALGRASVDECASLDTDGSGAVSVDELVGAVQHLLQGCGAIEPLERAPVALVRHPSWELVPENEDIFLPLRPDDWFCDPTAFRFEILSGQPSVEVRSELCNYLTIRQPIREPVRQGDELYISLWHFQLTIPPGTNAYMAVSANGCILWEAERRIPTTAALLEARFPAPFPMPDGTPIYFHVQNHGANTYHLLEISAGGSVNSGE